MSQQRITGQMTGSAGQMAGLRIGDAGEVFNIRLDYLELDTSTGRTQERTFNAQGLARTAAGALQHALEVFLASQGEISPNGLIWQLTARVEVQGDVLRDKLRETQQ